jgi:6-phosphogluconolactonase/glucosamine-6-phosphate isomerase/deaminase
LGLLGQAREIFLLAAGRDKSAAVEDIFCGGETSGAAVARWSQTTCLVDDAAGSGVLAAGELNGSVAI